MLEVGKKAPNFKLPDETGKIHSLKDYLGKKVILYFYPKDNTSGCTKQACGFKEIYPQIKRKGAVVIGISKDSMKSHQRFKDNYDLPFILLCDEDTKVIQKYDVWKEKSMYGKKYMGIERSTYVIDEKGKIIETFQKVKPADNPKEVFKVL